ncbi:Transmembrane protein 65-like [Phytophthora palmivora]|uniref:Transmembrane protein 65-like n=1 Tax=Phytophthora palmivora TaxID=4796 RepID=A0A2P4YEJ9_9STRA|nr:Transmembrane protein 65-like [Phytophthora palmivora]
MFSLHHARRLARRRTVSCVTAAIHTKPPASTENAALLRDLETALKTDPEAVQRLSALLSPSTTRNLSNALNSVRKGSLKAVPTEAIAVTPPTTQELKMVALQMGLPFIGFGFVDNSIMILAGDYIDMTLGVSLGISSMAAAGFGNIFADIAGLGTSNVVEDFCARLGLPVPALTTEQSTRMAKVTGSCVGVTIGCLLGMAPLLFLETRGKDDNSTPSNDNNASN